MQHQGELRVGVDNFLSNLAAANELRAPDFHAGGLMDWSPAERGNELAGETGEACNELKKLLRFDRRTGTRMLGPGMTHWVDADEATQIERAAILERIRNELGDVVICASLIARQLGIDLQQATLDKFNATSDKIGSKVKL
jgi:NTP pyrophosphatase (non-canonical NTP hydrolase)